MSKRREHLNAYVEGARSMNAKLVLSALAEGFVFDDPALPEPVTKATMVDYMSSWEEKTKALSGNWRYENFDEVVQDRDGVLLRWKWWRFTGTNIQGSALTKTTDDGMVYERIAYYPNTPTLIGEGMADERNTYRHPPADTPSRQRDVGLVIGEAEVKWQSWDAGSKQACPPRYKTFFAGGDTPTSGLVQGIL